MGEDIIRDKSQIKEGVLQIYEELYTERESWRPTSNFEGMATILEEESLNLEAPFLEEEVLAVIQSFAPDKAQGPDGIQWLCTKNFGNSSVQTSWKLYITTIKIVGW